ncbi:MAG: hypothetical protein AB7L09_00110 [Nitrospira sp.]
MTHDDLVTVAKKWLIKARQCTIVLTETQAQNGETPDAIGWRGQLSILIECKTSLADFRRDLNKWFRNAGPGIGQRRYFMAPQGVIPLVEIPSNWGLLEVDGNTVKTTKSVDLLYLDERVSAAEVPMLVAALRRSKVRKAMRKRNRRTRSSSR